MTEKPAKAGPLENLEGTLLEKGEIVASLEGKLAEVKEELVCKAIIEECALDARTIPELENSVKARTGLEVSGKFVSGCAESLAAGGKLDKMGNLFVCPKSLRESLPLNEDYASEIEEREVIANLLEEKEMLERPARSEDFDEVMKLVSELEKAGPVPVETLLSESEKKGIAREEAMKLIREHVEVTGYLYEPKDGHVKTVKAITN